MAAFIDGFEQFLDDALTLVPLAGYTAGEVSTASGRKPGSTALLLTAGQLSRSVPLSGNIASVGAAVRFEQRGSVFMQAQTATVQASPITGRLTLNGVTGEVIPAADRYYYYELELDWANDEARLYVNGRLDITSPYTGAAPSDLDASLTPVASGESISPISVDDFYVNDGPRLGPIEIMTQMANTDGSPQDWQPSVDDEAHSAIVGAQPPDMLNRYVQSDVIGAEDRYTSDTVAERNDTVRAVAIIALARVTANTAQTMLVSSGTNEVAASPLASNYAYYYTQVPFAPGVLANTLAGQPMGVKVGAP